MLNILYKSNPEEHGKSQITEDWRVLVGDKPTRVRRMIINLKPGDRIRVSGKELSGSKTNSLIETEVLEVQQSAGWYRVLTSCGVLKPHHPTDKYELLEAVPGLC